MRMKIRQKKIVRQKEISSQAIKFRQKKIVRQKEIGSQAIKFFIENEGVEIGRAYLFFISNGLHDKPYGLLEDVFVREEFRGQSLGTELVKAVIEVAREKCYKLIGTSRHSRPKVHAWYEGLGFGKHGVEFRMDFK